MTAGTINKTATKRATIRWRMSVLPLKNSFSYQQIGIRVRKKRELGQVKRGGGAFRWV